MKIAFGIILALAIIISAPQVIANTQIFSNTQSVFGQGINTSQLCINGDCKTAWPAGGSTFSGLVPGQILVATNTTNAATENVYFADTVSALRTYAAIPGASIFVAAGNYTVTGTPILVASNVSIQANPRTAFFIAGSGLNTHVFASSGRSSYITLAGLDINGNVASNTAGDCLRFDGFYNTFDNLWVQSCAESGLRLNSTASSAENRILNGRYNGTHSGIRIDSGNQDFYIQSVTFNGGIYGLYADGNGGHWNYLNFFGQSFANIYTSTAASTFGIRFGSAPIGLYINGTANNIIGIWSGMNLNSWTVDNAITSALIVANISSPNTMYLNVNNWVGTYTAEDLRLVGNGTSRLAITSTYKTLSVNNTGHTIDSQSYVIQPLRASSSVPSTAVSGTIYLDTGTNTATGVPALRRLNSSGSWVDLDRSGCIGGVNATGKYLINGITCLANGTLVGYATSVPIETFQTNAVNITNNSDGGKNISIIVPTTTIGQALGWNGNAFTTLTTGNTTSRGKDGFIAVFNASGALTDSGEWAYVDNFGMYIYRDIYSSNEICINGNCNNRMTPHLAVSTITQNFTSASLTDTNLVMSITDNAVYSTECVLQYNSSATGNGLRIGFTGPTASYAYYEAAIFTGDTAISGSEAQAYNASIGSSAVSAGGNIYKARISGIFNLTSTGNLVLRAARSDGSSTTSILPGSRCTATRVG